MGFKLPVQHRARFIIINMVIATSRNTVITKASENIIAVKEVIVMKVLTKAVKVVVQVMKVVVKVVVKVTVLRKRE